MNLNKIIELLRDESLLNAKPEVFEAICLAHNILNALQPRPIEEARKDTEALVLTTENSIFSAYLNQNNNWRADDPDGGGAYGLNYKLKSFIPLSAIQALFGGKG